MAKGFGLGQGLTFDVTEWRQGTLCIEARENPLAASSSLSSSSSSSAAHVLTFNSPYRTYRKHSAPMLEVAVDVTSETRRLMEAGALLEPVHLGQQVALMAFRRGAPLVGSVFLLPSEVARAVTPDPVRSWLPQAHLRTEPRRGGGRG